MKTITVTVPPSELRVGDQILEVNLGVFLVSRKVPDKLSSIQMARILRSLDRNSGSRDDVRRLIGHIKAGGDLPDEWTYGVDESGAWIRDGRVTRTKK